MDSTSIALATASQPTVSTIWLVICALLAGAALAMMYIPSLPSCLTAYVAMWAAKIGGVAPFGTGTMVFWGVATLIIIINHRLLPRMVRNSRLALSFIATGALAGMAVGLTLGRAASIILGSALGAIFGAIACSRTKRGASLAFPTARFFNYLGAKGIPAVVCSTMIGLIVAMAIANSLF